MRTVIINAAKIVSQSASATAATASYVVGHADAAGNFWPIPSAAAASLAAIPDARSAGMRTMGGISGTVSVPLSAVAIPSTAKTAADVAAATIPALAAAVAAAEGLNLATGDKIL